MNAFSLRDFDPTTDFPAMVRLLNAWQISPTSEETERDAYAQWSATPHQALVAEQEGITVGFGRVSPTRGMVATPGSHFLELQVAASARGTGIGRTLFARLEQFARQADAVDLRARVLDNDPDSRAFAERRGFVRTGHTFLSLLDVVAFQPDVWADAVAAVEAQGIRLTDYAALGDTPESRRQFYALNRAAHPGEPNFGGDFLAFDAFVRQVFENAGFFPEGQILALDGSRMVGIAALLWIPRESVPFHAFTGVLPEYRRRGIAQALKVKAVEAARRRGATHIRTGNDSRNAGMLAINRRLGYVPTTGIFRMVRTAV